MSDDTPNVPEDIREVWETALELDVIGDNWSLMQDHTKHKIVKRSATNLKAWFREEKKARSKEADPDDP